MRQKPLNPAVMVKKHAELLDLANLLRRESLVAVDTESNSLHAYQEKVCLLQFSTRDQDFIVDPIAINDLSVLESIFSSPDQEIIFHAAEYDIACLKRDYGFQFNNLFDTMTAARICGLEHVGLSHLLETYFDVKADKSHQRDNWGKRPLPTASLEYAQMDTHYLPELRDILYALLEQHNRLDEAMEAFQEIAETQAATEREVDLYGFWNIGKPAKLNTTEMKILREVYFLRERIAKGRDVPPFRVMSNNLLVTIARHAPGTIPELKTIRAMSARQVRRYGKRVLKAVKAGKSADKLVRPPRPTPPEPVVTDRYAALHLWRKERAIQRGVESDIIVSKQTLWDLAHQAPKNLDEMREINGLGPWRLGAYGEEILNVLDGLAEGQ